MTDSPHQQYKGTTLSGTFWSYAAFFSGKLMVFISTLILAQLLTQDDYGIAGYALVVISFLDVISTLGIGPAIIYYKGDPETNDTGFWLSLIMGGFLFILTWIASPWIGDFFNDPRAVPVTRALALTFPISALGNVHSVLLSKEFQFRRKFIPDFTKAIGKGVFSILFAALQFGPWSLIIGQIAGTAASVVAYWLTLSWRPRWRFSPAIAKNLVAYGLNIVVVNIISSLQSNSDYLVIGRFLGSTALGIYSLAFRIPELLIMQFCSIISNVVFPIYARIREDANALTQGFLATTRAITLVTVPIGLGLAITSRPFILVCFTEKWAEAIPIAQVIALYALFNSLSYNAGDAFKAQGRPQILTYISISTALLQIPALVWAAMVPGSILAVGWVQAGMALLTTLVTLVLSVRLLHVTPRSLFQAYLPAFRAGAVMSACVFAALWLLDPAPALVQLVVCVLVGALAYGATLWFTNRHLLLEGYTLLRKSVQNKFAA